MTMWRILFVLCPQIFAYRQPLRDESLSADSECDFNASETDDSFAVNSLIFEDPDFSFLDSREFFLSPVATCDQS
eukprot:Skav235464  [mRNA]  locus=scaffold1451:81589:82867:+ [translate_table: standard]